jgi:hypothetical protein
MSKPGELYIGDLVRRRSGAGQPMTIYDFEHGYRTALCNYVIGTQMYRERVPVEALFKIERKRTK